MKPNHSVPPATVVPILVYPDVHAAVDWLAGAFGFREHVRIGESHHAQLSVGADGAVIVADVHGEQVAPDSGRVTHLIRVRVDDVDGHHAGRGTSARPCSTDRSITSQRRRDYTVEDLAGHRWNFSESIHDVIPEEFGCETIEAWSHRT